MMTDADKDPLLASKPSACAAWRRAKATVEARPCLTTPTVVISFPDLHDRLREVLDSEALLVSVRCDGVEMMLAPMLAHEWSPIQGACVLGRSKWLFAYWTPVFARNPDCPHMDGVIGAPPFCGECARKALAAGATPRAHRANGLGRGGILVRDGVRCIFEVADDSMSPIRTPQKDGRCH